MVLKLILKAVECDALSTTIIFRQSEEIRTIKSVTALLMEDNCKKKKVGTQISPQSRLVLNSTVNGMSSDAIVTASLECDG